MEKRNTSLFQKLKDGKTCRHYWLLETPNGDTCKGICRFCREEREFASYIETAMDMKTNMQSVKKDVLGN